jgi:hypothetical protein
LAKGDGAVISRFGGITGCAVTSSVSGFCAAKLTEEGFTLFLWKGPVVEFGGARWAAKLWVVSLSVAIQAFHGYPYGNPEPSSNRINELYYYTT